MNVAIKLNFLSLTDAPEDVFNFFQEYNDLAEYIDAIPSLAENLFPADINTLHQAIIDYEEDDDYELPEYIVAFYKDLETLPEYDDHTVYFRFEKF